MTRWIDAILAEGSVDLRRSKCQPGHAFRIDVALGRKMPTKTGT